MSDIIWYLSLTALSVIISKLIQADANGIILFFLWLSNTPLHICTTSSWSFLQWWTFSCCCVLAIVNSVAVNTEVHVSFWIMIFSRYMPRMGLLDHRVILFLVFWLYQFTLPPTIEDSSLFSTPCPAFFVCRPFDDGHSDWCMVIPHHSFDSHFSKT